MRWQRQENKKAKKTKDVIKLYTVMFVRLPNVLTLLLLSSLRQLKDTSV